MTATHQLAKYLRDVHFGGNWTAVNLRDTLADVTWQQAATPVYGLNTISTLVFHLNYYLNAVLAVVQGNALTAKHELSFVHEPITSAEAWEALLQKTWRDAETLASCIEHLPELTLFDTFSDVKYGNYYRNIQGIIEHSHYHLGQMVLLKKLLAQPER